MRRKLEVSYGLHSTYNCCIRIGDKLEIFTASNLIRDDINKRDISVKARLAEDANRTCSTDKINLNNESISFTVWMSAQYISIKVSIPNNLSNVKLDTLELSLGESRKYILKILDLTEFISDIHEYKERYSSGINSISTLCSNDYTYASRYIKYYSKIGINLFIIFLDLSIMGIPNKKEIDKLISLANQVNIKLLIIESDCNYVHRNTPAKDDSYIEGSGRQGIDFFYVLSPILVNLAKVIASYSRSNMHLNADLDEFSIFPGCSNGSNYNEYLIKLMKERNNDFDPNLPYYLRIREIPALLNKNLDAQNQNPLDCSSLFSRIPIAQHRNTKLIILNPSLVNPIFTPCPHLPPTFGLYNSMGIQNFQLSSPNKTDNYTFPIKTIGYIHYINQSDYARKDETSYYRKVSSSDLVKLKTQANDDYLLPEQILEIQKEQIVKETYVF